MFFVVIVVVAVVIVIFSYLLKFGSVIAEIYFAVAVVFVLLL